MAGEPKYVPSFVATALEILEKRGEDPVYKLRVKDQATILKYSYWCVLNQMSQIASDLNPDHKHTRKETADLFGISLPTLDKYIKLGFIQSEHFGRRIYFSTSAIKIASEMIVQAKYLRL